MNPTQPSSRIPWTLVASAAALMLVGFSGILRGDEMTGLGQFARKQMLWMALSLPVMFAATIVSYRRIRWWSYPLFGFSVLLLGLVYLMPPVNGSRRWIPLGFMNFQPSELAKLAYIMALAHYMMHRENYRNLLGLVVPFLITLVPVGLILREPDLGTSLLFLPVLFAMLFAAGARVRHLVLIWLLGVMSLPLLWLGMSAEQKSRVVTVVVQKDGGPAPRGDGYHLHQSKQVLSLGRILGSEFEGMPVDDPQAYHLPAGRTDFIFCLVGERWGLLGCLVTVGLYLFLCARGLMVAQSTQEPFGRLLVVGIVTLIATQVIINTCMTVGLMPITGLTLPLMSYGGSSLLATCLALGLIINVAMRPGYEMTGEPFRFASGRG